jgi:hypothetical protein
MRVWSVGTRLEIRNTHRLRAVSFNLEGFRRGFLVGICERCKFGRSEQLGNFRKSYLLNIHCSSVETKNYQPF